VLGTAYLMKKEITLPRYGSIEFSKQRQKREKKMNLISIAVGITIFLVIISGYMFDIAFSFPLLPISLIFIALITTTGLMFDTLRVHLYSLITYISTWLLSSSGIEKELHFVITGTIIILISIIQTIKFMRKYPLKKK
jgi:membrane-associated HD superfamily phosphohydrolase